MSDYNDYMELKQAYYEHWSQTDPKDPEILRWFWSELERMQREDAPLSLDALTEMGMEIADVFSLENHIMEQELSEALADAISTLSEKNQTIILLFSEGVAERTIATKIGMSHKEVNNRIHKIITILQESLKDFF